jgi:hypothetical protein
MDGYAAATAEALTDPDPWHGFTRYIEAVCAMQAADRAFADVLTPTFPAAKALEARRAEAYNGLVEIVHRGKATGRLRADVVPEGLVILFMANAGVIAATADAAPDSCRRLVGHLLRGFASADTPMPTMPEDVVPPEAAARHLDRWNGRAVCKGRNRSAPQARTFTTRKEELCVV